MNLATIVGLKLNSPTIRPIAAVSADESKEIETKHQTSQRHHRRFLLREGPPLDRLVPHAMQESPQQPHKRMNAVAPTVSGSRYCTPNKKDRTTCPAGNDAAPPRTRPKATIVAACRVRKSMEIYPRTAAERPTKLQEVLLRTTVGKIKGWQAAELMGISERQMRRWRKGLEEPGQFATVTLPVPESFAGYLPQA